MKRNWDNFKEEELVCSCCGRFNPNPEFEELMDIVQELREELGVPMKVTSAYRCTDHPIEAAKIKKNGVAGEHTRAAIDIGVSHHIAFNLVKKALEKGITGLGVNQKGNGRFIHLDLRQNPTIWSY